MSELSTQERSHFRDMLREARYGALADAEGFQQMCFAVEALGKRLKPSARGLSNCRLVLKELVVNAGLLSQAGEIEGVDKRFDALFLALKDARNDMAHTGAYARHVAVDAVALCLVIEEALMSERMTVQDFMVTTPVTIHPWQTVGYARQLMLLNSFSYLPMWDGKSWRLLSDSALVEFLLPDRPATHKKKLHIKQAETEGLKLPLVSPVDSEHLVTDLLKTTELPGLWLVVKDGYPPGHLAGVLSPFELM